MNLREELIGLFGDGFRSITSQHLQLGVPSLSSGTSQLVGAARVCQGG